MMIIRETVESPAAFDLPNHYGGVSIVKTKTRTRREVVGSAYCPECGDSPTICTGTGGYTCFLMCRNCLWEGNTRDMSIDSFTALHHWNEKVNTRINETDFVW